MRYAIIVVLLLSGCVTDTAPPNITDNDTNITVQEEINSFEECVEAGNPVMESYPRQCRANGKTFLSLTDLFDSSKNASCAADDDCRLVNSGHAFACCWAGACDEIDYSSDKWIAVNKEWFENTREQHCPADCGPAPGCAVRAVNENFTAVCQDGICEKVPIIAVNLTANNITVNETNASAEEMQEINETEEIPEGFPIGGYMLVLDDVVVHPDNCGAFSVRHANGTVIDKLLICEKESTYWIGPDGHKYRILVVKVAAGYTQKENWADVRIYG